MNSFEDVQKRLDRLLKEIDHVNEVVNAAPDDEEALDYITEELNIVIPGDGLELEKATPLAETIRMAELEEEKKLVTKQIKVANEIIKRLEDKFNE